MVTPQPQKPSAKPVAKTAPLEPPVRKALWTPCGWSAHLGVIALLAALVLFTFVDTFYRDPGPGMGFALDNKFIILEDPRLREAKWDNVKLIFTQDYWWPKAVSGLYRPLTTLSYLFNYAVLHGADKAVTYNWLKPRALSLFSVTGTGTMVSIFGERAAIFSLASETRWRPTSLRP